jgi:hypothetical protein
MNWRGHNTAAHRIAYEMCFGPIAKGLCVLHSCDNPPCINPMHLSLGTKADNAQQREARGRGYDRSGERNGRAKLTNAQVVDLRRTYKLIPRRSGRLQVAKQLGVSQALVNKIIHGDNW